MVSALTDEQLEELKTAFDMFDKDGDGISREELEDAMKTFGKAPTPEELDEMMRNADEDGSGTIDFQEFLKMMAGNLESGA
jgi:calmodulin